VLAQVTGMHINTAVRWGKYAERDWAAYVAERITPDPPETGIGHATRSASPPAAAT
jgi:hypothetical protein